MPKHEALESWNGISCLGKCGKVASYARGLCEGCYKKILKAVREGGTTWEKAIAEGRAMPAKTMKQRSENFHGKFIKPKNP